MSLFLNIWLRTADDPGISFKLYKITRVPSKCVKILRGRFTRLTREQISWTQAWPDTLMGDNQPLLGVKGYTTSNILTGTKTVALKLYFGFRGPALSSYQCLFYPSQIIDHIFHLICYLNHAPTPQFESQRIEVSSPVPVSVHPGTEPTITERTN